MIHRDNTFGTPEEDAFRRDFTVNAISWDPLTDEYVDPCNGREDLERRALRVVDPDTFADDSLQAGDVSGAVRIYGPRRQAQRAASDSRPLTIVRDSRISRARRVLAKRRGPAPPAGPHRAAAPRHRPARDADHLNGSCAQTSQNQRGRDPAVSPGIAKPYVPVQRRFQ